MKKASTTLLLLFYITFVKAGLLHDITDGTFRAKTPASLRSMNDGEHFTQLMSGKHIVKFNYKTGLTVDTLLSLSKVKEAPLSQITGYSFSPDEQKILVYTRPTYRYRRTFTANYYIYDVRKKTFSPLSDKGEQEVPMFSPDGASVAFARKNNLYLKNLAQNTETQITGDGEFNKIINGTPDWVYEEEFGITRYFLFSPDSKFLAYVKFDETEVPMFSMMRYLDDNLPENQLLLYPTVETFKYPKAGQKNSLVSVWMYNISTQNNQKVNLGTSVTDFYIPRLKWTRATDKLAVFLLNRHQNKLDMLFANTSNGQTELVFTDTDKYYVDYENIDDIDFQKENKSFVLVSERDGYRHAYLFDIQKKSIKQITKGAWDITKVYGYDEKAKKLYYQSAEVSPMCRDIYSIDTKGNKLKLADGKGTHDASFSNNYAYFIDNFSSVETPNVVNLRDNKGKVIREILNNQSLLDKFTSMKFPKKEFFSFTTSEGVTLNGWMVKPQHLEENKKYPLLMVQYSGPNSQQALDRWGVDWEYFLSTQGYAVACVDGRGTGARGEEFRKCTYQKLGVLETKDQVEGASYLGTLPFVDKDRIGIWGWSYGGFMTLNALSAEEHVFKAGIAVAPVTDWRFYNSAYTERFMRTPQENPEGYDAGSPMKKVKNLQGNLLLIHGTADDNVHVQNTMVYLDKITDAGKQIQLYTYTDKNHSILGKDTRRNLYDKKFEFLEKYLK